MMEEYKYCLRAKRAGFRHYAVPVPLLVPLGDEPPGTYPPWRGYYLVRNHLWFPVVQGRYLVGALRVGKRVGERLLGAWRALRGVTGRTIDPAWRSAGGSGAAPARRR